ncbi:tetratricopeptide repeat protein [Gammaproteobacteria bacterium]|nr:tetratricopeptide repeat protein [Gammaproteobacteria bacterium]
MEPRQELSNTLQRHQDELSPAIELREVGKYKEAQESLSKVIEQDSKNAEALSLLSQVFLLDKKEVEAERALKEAASINSDLPSVYRNQARLLLKQSKIAEALEKAQLGCSQSAQDSEGLLVLAGCLVANQRDTEALPIIENLLKADSNYAEAYANRALIKLRAKDAAGAIKDAETTVSLKPHLTSMWQLLGSLYYQSSNLNDAIVALRSAHKNEPNNPAIMIQLGEFLRQDNKVVEAINILEQATELAPEDANAWTNFGVALQQDKKIENAKTAYKMALVIKPKSAEVLSNLGIIAMDAQDLESAQQYFRQALEVNPYFAGAYFNLAASLKGYVFNKSEPGLQKVITSLLDKGTYARPADISKAAISLLKYEPLLQKSFKKHFAGKLRQSLQKTISRLSDLPLLLQLMRVCPIPDLEIEALLNDIRSCLLFSVSKSIGTPEVFRFQSALALQCFTNEYIYSQTNKETKAFEKLECEIERGLYNGIQPSPQSILCLASYKALHEYEWSKLLTRNIHIEKVFARQILEPKEEARLKPDIPALQELTDKVSLRVREQYEASPYPRWINLGIDKNPKAISEIFKDKNLRLCNNEIIDVEAPSILVAGCGTGQHSIGSASQFKNSKVLAVDLSLISLAYAKRKTKELGVHNLEYMQADILDLEKLDMQFDVIESAGVLHHMENPMAGWEVLTNCLVPNGLMRIGLYSKLARQHITEMRDEIDRLGLEPSDDSMKFFRSTVINSDEEHHKKILPISDFYSLSTLRDLLFHVQEHQFSIPQIKKCLDELGLKFCGFENKKIVKGFKQSNPEPDDIFELDKWHRYEEANPISFMGMYQFWCQKL